MSGQDLLRVRPTEIKNQCTAHKKDGVRCKRSAIKGGNVCPKHGGSAPQTVAAARRRLLAAADPLMANLLKIATSSDDEALRLRATMDALTRAGVTEKGTVAVEVTHSFDEVLAGIIDDSVTVRRESGTNALPAVTSTPGTGDSDDEAAADAADAAFYADAASAAEQRAEAEASRRAEQARVAAAGGGASAGPWPDVVPGEVHRVTRLPYDAAEPPAYLRDRDDGGWG